MCGIFGVSWSGQSKKFKSPLAARMLTYMNQERGKDSVGIAFLDKVVDGEGEGWATYRSLGDPHLMLRGNPFDFKAFKSNVVLGHCRSASGGTAHGTLETVHPFRFGNIILAHNGFITNWRALLDNTGEDKNKIDIDSKLLAWRVANMPIEDVFKDLIGKIATWWVDVNEPNHIYMYTWKKELAATNDGDHPFIFSSDINHLLALGVPKDNVTNFDQDIGQLIRVDIDTANTEVIGEYPCKPDTVVALPQRWSDDQRKTYLNIPNSHRRGFFRAGDDAPESDSVGIISTVGQLKAKWQVEGDGQEEKAKASWDILSAAFDGENIAQCWKCHTIFSPNKLAGGTVNWRCGCGGQATHSNEQEKFVIVRWIADQMLLEELHSINEMFLCDKATLITGHRKRILVDILRAAVDDRIETSTPEKEAEKAMYEDKLLEELEDNGEIIVGRIVKNAVMSARQEVDNPMAEGTP